MGTSPKSQWDFGELSPAEATRKVLSVSELTARVKRLLEKQVGSVWVNVEITIKWILTLSSCPSNPVADAKFTTHSRTKLDGVSRQSLIQIGARIAKNGPRRS